MMAMRSRDEPAQPRRDADVQETFHHHLAGERPGESRVLSGSEQRDGEKHAGKTDAEQRAEQFVSVLNFRDVLMSRPMEHSGGEHEDRGVDEEREHERAGRVDAWHI